MWGDEQHKEAARETEGHDGIWHWYACANVYLNLSRAKRKYIFIHMYDQKCRYSTLKVAP